VTSLRSGSATDIGRVRTSNQDVALEGPDLYAVADGMGGHAGGEVAARLAVDTLRSSFQRQPSVEGLRRAVAEANRAVWRQSQTESGLRGMGTTLTATALVRDAQGRPVIALANVGDSRAYVYSNGQAVQVTADHSLAEEKVRHGEMTEAEAAVHPHRHILTRALGVASDVDVDLWELSLQHGDRILLCSDGLTNEIADERISETLDTVDDPREAARTLVRAAVEHGGNDNVTVVVLDVIADDVGVGVAAGTEGALGGRSAEAGGEGKNGETAGAVEGAQLADGAAPLGAGASAVSGAQTALGSQTAPGAPGAGSNASEPLTAGRGGGVLVADERAAHVPVRPVPSPAAGAPAIADRPIAAPSTPPRPAPERPSRRERRRQRRMAGIPRMITVRVVLFAVLVAAVVAAAYTLVRWYAMDDWYVAVDHQHLAIYQGRPSGFLWFKPKLVDETSVTTSGILPYRLPTVRPDKQEASLSAARRYVSNLHQEFLAVQQLGSGATPSSATTAPSTAPSTTTTTTAPSATTTLPPPAAGSQ
jgi:PPM family protein phosphatase